MLLVSLLDIFIFCAIMFLYFLFFAFAKAYLERRSKMADFFTVQLYGLVSAKRSQKGGGSVLAVYNPSTQRTIKIYQKGEVGTTFPNFPITIEVDVNLPPFVFMSEGSSARILEKKGGDNK